MALTPYRMLMEIAAQALFIYLFIYLFISEA
jgi:hypothetical protein